MVGRRRIALWALSGCVLGCVMSASKASHAADAKPAVLTKHVHWEADYDAAYRLARKEKKLLFIYFREAPAARTVSDGEQAPDPVEATVTDPDMQSRLDDFVFARLPMDATSSAEEKPVVLIEHDAFSELRGGPGIAIIDLAHPDADYFTQVVSVCPMTPGKFYRFQPEHVAVLFDLPSGTLNERTMVFAVRIHPEAPASTRGEDDPVLHEEAEGHSQYQAQIHVQGHQQWDGRFHRILARLGGRNRRGGGLAPREIVAESWPNQNLVDSCVDCVDSWRHSSGHWDAVRSEHDSYGYDIQQGTNGIWYATGIFSD